MHDIFRDTLERAERVRRDRIRPGIHRAVAPVALEAWTVSDAAGEPVSARHAIGLDADPGREPASYRPFEVGDEWAPAWGTTWFRVSGTVPEDDTTLELVLDLGWFDHSVGGHCEALVLTPDGHAVKGLHPRSRWVRLRDEHGRGPGVDDDGHFVFYIEAAANPLILGLPPFVQTGLGRQQPTDDFERFRVRRAEIARFDPELFGLDADIEAVAGLVRITDPGQTRHWKLLHALEVALDTFTEQDPSTVGPARARLAQVLNAPASPSAHQLSAVGHSHIDSAWLWPLRETHRKVARTVSNVLDLMDRDPGFQYAMSSAQQYLWLEQEHPDLFARLRQRVEEGRFIPVGGTWVEPDGIMPTGESMVRQITMAKRYFGSRFGIETREVWLPDSFGYSAAFPQIARRAGNRWFLTQKISWNDSTDFPHHTFWWRGIDGTRIFTHFPPVDTYAANVTAEELRHAEQNFRDKAIASRSLLLYGYGDGGGGPTREMLAAIQRFADVEGAPKVVPQPPSQFFADAEAELVEAGEEEPSFAPEWSGELYLERHRGTLTSQHAVKIGNRRCEALLRTAEYLCASATLRNGAEYPYGELDSIWRDVLLLQFHDVLPGSAIAWVYADAQRMYASLTARATALIDTALAHLRAAVLDGLETRLAIVAPSGAGADFEVRDETPSPSTAVVCEESRTGWRLANEQLEVRFDPSGRTVSVIHGESGRQLVAPGRVLNEPLLYVDEPTRWDAWDIDRDVLRRPQRLAPTSCEAVHDDGRAGLRVEYRFGASRAVLTSWLAGGSGALSVEAHVDWHEHDRLLKVALPTEVRADTVACETQYGFVRRTLHPNSAADAATFEFSQHRFSHLCEPGWEVGIVNDSIYGLSADSGPGDGAELQLSLLRGPRFPDPDTDQHAHRFRWSVLPGATIEDTLAAANRMAAPKLAQVPAIVPPIRLRHLEGSAVIDWVKLADDRSGDLIARIYETRGGRARAELAVDPRAGLRPDAQECDLLERPAGQELPPGLTEGGDIALGPFQVLTLRFTTEFNEENSQQQGEES